ncbi:hypothetical protein [Clostridium sp. UBA1353]|uniref:hypothetical protein n=1 Tax=Clostridium sp. UBA1353 TaxID=1946347 RepID=UPI0032180B53
MDKKYIKYFETLEVAGDKILNSAKYFSGDLGITYNERLSLINKGLTEYRGSLILLQNVDVPDLVKAEHIKLVNEWNRFIKVTENEFAEITNNNNKHRLKEIVIETENTRQPIIKNIVNVCNLIGDKIEIELRK